MSDFRSLKSQGKLYMQELQRLTKRLSSVVFFNNKLCSAITSKKMNVISPIHQDIIGNIPLCGASDIDRIVNLAKTAQPLWANIPMQQRAKFLRQCNSAIAFHANELAQLISFETGKALQTEARPELAMVEDILNYYAGIALEIKGQTTQISSKVLALTLHEPIGVVAGIIAWNAPLMLMMLKIAPALITGNTVVLKPAPEASFSVLRAAEILGKVLPAGVLNIVTGDGLLTGQALVKHPNVSKITFTGSLEAGKSICSVAREKMIPLTLELGGKSPFIVYPDADIDRAVDDAIYGMRFTRQGQSCTATSRLFLHKTIMAVFVKKMKARLQKLVLGHPLHANTDVGTIVSCKQYDKIVNFVKQAQADKKLHVEQIGKLPSDKDLQKGLFILPTIISGLTNKHPLCQQEIFGPVVCVMPWEDENRVLEEANDTVYGLAAAIWTNDLEKAMRAVKGLDAGFVHVNQYDTLKPGISFGGFKQSGMGKEYSKNAMIENFTKEKVIFISTS